MFETLEAVGQRPWTCLFQSGLSRLFCDVILPGKLRGGISSFAPRSSVERVIARAGVESMGRGLDEAEYVIEERLELSPQTKRLQLELPFDAAPAPVEEVQQDLWPEGLESRAAFTAVDKIATGSGPWVDEREFLGMVASPAFDEARHRARRLELRPLSATQEAFRRALLDASVARSPRKIRWGEEPCVDALRLRYVRCLDWKHREDRRSIDHTVWLGALEWLGTRIAEAEGLRKAPQKSWRVLAASIAASRGYRRSLEWLRSLPDEEQRYSWVSIVALRSVFEDGVSPYVLSSLLPPRGDETRRLRSDSPWLPLSLALRWAVENRRQAGVVFAVSAIVATAFRRSFEIAAAREGMEIQVTSWGCGLPPNDERVACFDRLGGLCARGWSPFKEEPFQAAEEGTDLDLSEIASILRRVLGDLDLFHFGLLCLDEHLLHASLFTLLGNVPSARVHLALSPRPPWTRGVGVASEPEEPGRSLQDLLERSPLGSERAKVYSALEGTPDPSVALGTPVWSLSDHLGDVASVFMRAGRGRALRSVRSLLQREDLKKTVRPYWLLSGRDRAGLVAAMKWAGGLEPYPEEEAWWVFLESQARRVLEAKPWTH